MKKTLLLTLALILMILALPASAGPGDAVILSQEQRKEIGISPENYGTSMVAMGDTLYLLTGTDILTWKAGEEKPALAASGLPKVNWYDGLDQAKKDVGDQAIYALRYLFSWEDKLYGLNGLTGAAFPLTIEGGKVTYGDPVQLDWEDMILKGEGYSYPYTLMRPTVAGGKLYTILRGYNEDYDKTLFLSFDLQTGERQKLAPQYVQDISAYKDGTLLLKVYDQSKAYDEEKGAWRNPTLAIWDPAAQTSTDVGEMDTQSVYGIVYSPENDTLYYTTANQIRMMPALGASVQAAFLPLEYGGEFDAVMLSDGLYVLNAWDQIYVRNADPQYLPTKILALYGMYSNNAYRAFTASHPDVAVTINQDTYYETTEAMAQAMVSKDKSFDIYQLNLGYDGFVNLMEKGYCADLTDLGTLQAEVSKMYPFLQETVRKDGRLYAVPTEMYGYGLSYYKKNWEEAGIPLDKLPRTFLQYVEFIAWWAEEGKDAYPGYNLVEGIADYKAMLFDKTIELYLQHYQATGEKLSFDTPLFRKLMAALESINYEEINVQAETDEDYTELYEIPSLFMDYYDWLNVYSSSGNSYVLLPLPLDEGLPVLVAANVQVALINPNSANIDLAVEYLESQLMDMDRYLHILLFPEDNEPVPNERYEETIKTWEKQLASLQETMLTAAPEEKKNLQTQIDMYQDILSHKEDYQWNISKEGIAAYREMAKNAFAMGDSVLNYRNQGGAAEIRELMSRYRDGQLPLEQFIREVDNKVRMIQMERQ